MCATIYMRCVCVELVCTYLSMYRIYIARRRYVCYHHAWFDQQLPLTWRVTVGVGNMLTVVWTTQMCGLLMRMARGEKGGDPMDAHKKDEKGAKKSS